jgi:hypothetical protein
MTSVGPRIFLSYAREDADRVAALYRNLRAAGFSPWMDTQDIPPGTDWNTAIHEAIKSADFFLACISHSSIRKTGVLADEIQSAVEIWKRRHSRDIYLIPVRLEASPLPDNLQHLQWADVFTESDWTRVADSIRKVRRGRVRLYIAAATACAMVVAAILLWLHFRGQSVDARDFRLPGGPPRLGVTVWRLAESGEPRRVPSGKMLNAGDHVRLSIESGIDGYLYVFDQEQPTDLTKGGPLIIFPTQRTRGGANYVRARRLVQIPELTDEPPYLTLQSSNAAYSGEWLTLILTPRPLPDFAAAPQAQRIPPARFDSWLRGFSTAVQQIEYEQGANALPSRSELEAAGNGAKELIHEDPPPQTTYRLKNDSGGLLVSFPLRVAARRDPQ